MDALARFHGAWWDHPLLDGGAIRLSPWCADPAAYDDLTTSRRQDWERFLEAEGGWFPADLRALYESVLAAAPLLRGRSFPRRRQRTLTHNDCYFSNWLSPLRPASGPPRLIDWQSPEVSPGPFDLVPLLATFVTPDQRREGGFEARLLRRYHAGLVPPECRATAGRTATTTTAWGSRTTGSSTPSGTRPTAPARLLVAEAALPRGRLP